MKSPKYNQSLALTLFASVFVQNLALASSTATLNPTIVNQLESLDANFSTTRVTLSRALSWEVEALTNGAALRDRGIQFSVEGNVSEFVVPRSVEGKIVGRDQGRSSNHDAIYVSFNDCQVAECAFKFVPYKSAYYLAAIPSDLIQGSLARVYSTGVAGLTKRLLATTSTEFVRFYSGRDFVGSMNFMEMSRAIKLKISTSQLTNVSTSRTVLSGYQASAAQPAPVEQAAQPQAAPQEVSTEDTQEEAQTEVAPAISDEARLLTEGL